MKKWILLGILMIMMIGFSNYKKENNNNRPTRITDPKRHKQVCSGKFPNGEYIGRYTVDGYEIGDEESGVNSFYIENGVIYLSYMATYQYYETEIPTKGTKIVCYD